VNIAETLNLTSSDHCYNIMPLFHIHGLIAILSSSIYAGASVYTSVGFNALNFLDKAKKENISWYSGVPTMHQGILMRAKKNMEQAKNLSLRFIRSSSASLPPAVFEELIDVFKAPVIEAYGMTEATHQMTSNPIPPEIQKAGFVGKPAGPDVCIMDIDGNKLEFGSEGEVCIHGDNVMHGYENNEEANKSSFTNGWFRTGDQGFFDKDGYLKISGRLKEIINRGGEKVSPLEIDNILMEHDAIEQVVTFGVKDKLLGEAIGVALVLKNGFQCTEKELKEYARQHLADFKIPKYICFLDEIPKGATGKLQRIGLAEKLGLE
jgi:acyl-CoA synthetase (AMP-forming)/AMP-acid ligase II